MNDVITVSGSVNPDLIPCAEALSRPGRAAMAGAAGADLFRLAATGVPQDSPPRAREPEAALLRLAAQ